MNKVYTVHAKRWGEHETHSYIVGVFSSAEKALQASIDEEYNRGGKYECEVMQWSMDAGRTSEPSIRPEFIKRIKD